MDAKQMQERILEIDKEQKEIEIKLNNSDLCDWQRRLYWFQYKALSKEQTKLNYKLFPL